MVCSSSLVMDANEVDSFVKRAEDLESHDLLVGITRLFNSLSQSELRFLSHVLRSRIEPSVNQDGTSITEDRNCTIGTSDAAEILRIPFGEVYSLLLCLDPSQQTTKRLIIERIAEQFREEPTNPKTVKEMRQLLAVASIHPVFSTEEREMFSGWSSTLDLRSCMTSSHPNSLTSLTSNDSVSLSPSSGVGNTSSRSSSGNSFNGHLPLSATMSAPASRRIVPGMASGNVVTDGHQRAHRSASTTLSSADESSSSILTRPPKPGMSMIATWLKTVRLHKYIEKFDEMSYEDMMGLSLDKLKVKGFTDGASNKMMGCIAELVQRPSKLRDLYEDLLVWTDIKPAMEELEKMLGTPIKLAKFPCRNIDRISYIEDLDLDDIAGRITFVIQRAIHVRKESDNVPEVEDEPLIGKLLKVIDKCVQHEAFYGVLRSALFDAKKELHPFRRQKNHAALRATRSNAITANDHRGLGVSMSAREPGVEPAGPRHLPLQRTASAIPSKVGPISQVIAANHAKKATMALKQEIIAKRETAKSMVPQKMPLSRVRSEPVRCMFDGEPMMWPVSDHRSRLEMDKNLESLTESLTLRVTELGLDS